MQRSITIWTVSSESAPDRASVLLREIETERLSVQRDRLIESGNGEDDGHKSVGAAIHLTSVAPIALLAAADRHHDGEVLCVIAADNHASRRVADKVGFRLWRGFSWPDDPATYDLLRRRIGSGGSPLLTP